MKKIVTKFVIISFLGSIVYLIFGWFVFDVLLGNYTDSNTTNVPGFKKNAEEFSLIFLYISCLAYSILISYILVLITNTNSLWQGFSRSSLIGVLVAIMADTFWYGSSHFYNNIWVMFSDIAAAAFTLGTLGLSITWLNTKLNKYETRKL